MDKNILKKLSYGVYVVATKDEEKLYGCIANSIMQINSDTIAISLNKTNDTTNALLKTKKLSINVLNKEANIDLITTFGFKKSNDYNKFDNYKYELAQNIPVLNNTCGYIIGNVINTILVDTHIMVLIKIIDMKKINDAEPMTYSYYQNNLKGKTNAAAPTYQEEKINTSKRVFVCKICGYKYETDLEELPDDFKCPMCGVGKDFFEKMQ